MYISSSPVDRKNSTYLGNLPKKKFYILVLLFNRAKSFSIGQSGR